MNKELDDTHEWRELALFKKGDFIHRWGDDLLVISVITERNYTTLCYMDDGREKDIQNHKRAQYIARKRCLN